MRKFHDDRENNEEPGAEKASGTAFTIENGASNEAVIIGVYGDVTETRAALVVQNLFYLQKDTIMREEDLPPEERTPIEFIVSTYGGSAVEMFAIYDMMKYVQAEVPVQTTGLGKVMSSGLLLLAAGTKGMRFVGANTRLMIHEVSSGVFGTKSHVENEIKESQVLQKQYLKCLADNTNLTEKQLRKLISGGKNKYLNAEQAVEFGFADFIL